MPYTWTDSDAKAVQRNYLEQRSGRWMYLALAETDRDLTRKELLRKLARYEEKHASHWATLLGRLNRPIPHETRFLQHRLLVWLARAFGVGTILPVVHRQEVDGIARYKDQAQKWEDPFAQEVFRELLPEEVFYEVSTVDALRKAPASPGSLRSAVLGANDGLASVLAITAGVVGATHSTSPVIIAGVAALVAGAVSMGAAGYVSVKAENEVAESRTRLERESVAVAPEAKRAQLEAAYREKGLTSEEALTVARRLAGNPGEFVKALLAEEHGIGESSIEEPGRLAVYTAVAFALAGTVPILPFLFLPVFPGVFISVGVSAGGLFLAGVLRALSTLSPFLRSGAEMVLVGMGAAVVTYLVGVAVGTVVG